MRPNPVSTSVQLPIPLTIEENGHMPLAMHRVLDAVASIAIVLLAMVVAGATVVLSA